MSVIIIAVALSSASGVVIYMKFLDNQTYKNFVDTVIRTLAKTVSDLNNETRRNAFLVSFNTNLTNSTMTLHQTLNNSLMRNVNISAWLWNKNNTIRNYSGQIMKLLNGTRYNLHDPSYAQMMSFLANDTTNNHTYNVSLFYVCRHFARDLKNNATAKGIRCGYVEVYGPDQFNINDTNQSHWTGHACDVFSTVDQGNIYVEPQNDGFLNVTKDTILNGIYIKDILVIW